MLDAQRLVVGWRELTCTSVGKLHGVGEIRSGVGRVVVLVAVVPDQLRVDVHTYKRKNTELDDPLACAAQEAMSWAQVKRRVLVFGNALATSLTTQPMRSSFCSRRYLRSVVFPAVPPASLSAALSMASH